MEKLRIKDKLTKEKIFNFNLNFAFPSIPTIHFINVSRETYEHSKEENLYSLCDFVTESFKFLCYNKAKEKESFKDRKSDIEEIYESKLSDLRSFLKIKE